MTITSPWVIPEQLLAQLRATPLRFYLLATVSGFVVAGFERATRWMPWLSNTDILAEGWGGGVSTVAAIIWVVAPVVALRLPLFAGVLALCPFAVTWTDGERTWPLTLFVSLLTVVMVGCWAAPRRAAVVALLALFPVATYAAMRTTIVMPYEGEISAQGVPAGLLTLSLYAAALLLALGAALWMRASFLSRVETLALRTRSAEVEQTSAVLAERSRLARDLHDVVAHNVSLIAVRAETAPYTVPDLSSSGRALVAEIAADSRRALDELRGVLGILRRAGDDPLRAPQPAASDIGGLIGVGRAAGETIGWDETDLESVSPTTGYAAYRVVQEALTNARRHAPGQPVTVETVLAEDLRIRVDNPFTGEAPAGHGTGLVGMRERVEGLGGTLQVISSDRTWSLQATLPR